LRRLTEQSEDYPRYPRLAPDGHRLAATLGPSQAGDIWIFDFKEGRQPYKVSFDEGHDTLPIWTKNGARIIYGSIRSNGPSLWSVASDGSERTGKPISLGSVITTTTIRALDITPDGLLLFSITHAKTRRDLMLVSLEDPHATPRAWLNAEYDEDDARVSPDGRFVAYVADPTGQPEIWVRPYPAPGAPVRISQSGGHQPVWSRDGKELFFQSGVRQMSAKILATTPELKTGVPQQLFEGGFFEYQPNIPRTYDVTPTGEFLMIQPLTDSGARPEIVMVLNWFEELKRLAPKK
jgi:Tol biopolymer transport system component